MKHQLRCALVAASVGLSVASAHAQGGIIIQGGPSGPGGAPQISFGGGANFKPMLGVGTGLRVVIRKLEVQKHLTLSYKQKQELGLLEESNANQSQSKTVRDANGEVTVSASPDGNQRAVMIRSTVARGPGAAPMTPEEQQKLAQELQSRVSVLMADLQKPSDEKIKEVLKPEQYARLLEIDLQYRGPLALADAKVAESLKLSAEARRAIAATQAEFQSQRAAMIQDAMDPQNPRALGEQMNNPRSPLSKKLADAKKAAEDKVLAALSADEAQRWQQAQGAPFRFRRV